MEKEMKHCGVVTDRSWVTAMTNAGSVKRAKIIFEEGELFTPSSVKGNIERSRIYSDEVEIADVETVKAVDRTVWLNPATNRRIIFCGKCREYVCQDGFCSNPFCPEEIV